MTKEAIELGMNLLALLAYSGLTIFLGAVGVFFELRSYAFLTQGEAVLGIWIGGLGIAMLLFAYLITRDKVRVALGSLVTLVRS